MHGVIPNAAFCFSLYIIYVLKLSVCSLLILDIILSYRLFLNLFTSLFPEHFLHKFCVLFFAYVLHALPISSSLHSPFCYYKMGARGNVVVKALCCKSEGRGFETRWGEWHFSIYLILPPAPGPGVYTASNRNEYQKQKNKVYEEWSAACAWGWQPYCHLWADCLDNVGSPTSHNPIGLHGLLRG
jgi:hypothetical protein